MTDAAQVDRTFREEILPELDAVYRFALHLARAPDRAEDLTQETFLRAYRNRASYSAGTRASSWLFTICRNLFLKGEERHRRKLEILEELADEDPRRISRETTVFMDARDRDPEEAFWNRIVDDEILRAIARLPTEFQEAVVLSDLEDLSYEGIAEVLGLPVGTVKSRLFRGRRMLQKELYAYAVEEGIISPVASSSSKDSEEELR